MKITKIIEFDMGHRIPNHKSQCRNLHGHRYKLEVSVTGEISQKKGESDEGMVLDFSDIKHLLKTEIHDVCDHAFMVYEGDSILIDFFHTNADLKVVIVPFIPTAEHIAQWIFSLLDGRFREKFGTQLQLATVGLWETPTSKAEITNFSQS